jgi:hypothetical protein
VSVSGSSRGTGPSALRPLHPTGGGVTGRTDTPPSGGLEARPSGGGDVMPCRKEGGDVQAQSAPAVSVAVELPNSLSPIADKQITMGMRLPPLQGAREWLHGLNAPAHAEASAQRPTETSCADPRALPVRGCRKTVWVHPSGARKRGGIPEPAWAVINSAAATCGCPGGGGEATTVSVNVGAGRV